MPGRNLRNPFASSTEATIAFTAPGATFGGARTQIDPSPLTNTFRMPIEIREIHVLIRTEYGINSLLTAAQSIYIDAKFGKHSITDGPVPLDVVAPFKVSEDNFGINQVSATTATRAERRRIVLPKPLIVLPGMGFNAVLTIPPNEFLATFDTTFTSIVTITMIGRFLSPADKLPEFNDVPMISHVQLSQTHRVSLENELQNPLTGPIKVHRMMGSVFYQQTIGGGSDFIRTLWESRGTTIQLHFPDSEVMSEDFVEFPRLFGQCRLWPNGIFEMPGNTRIRAEISLNALDTTETANTGYHVSLFGTRQEALS
jgi:hypothetical protein